MSSASSIDTTAFRAEAQLLGFLRVGFAPAGPVPEEVREHYLLWLHNGHHAGMAYLERYEAQRFNPHLLVPDVRTIVSLAVSYHPGPLPTQKGLAWYAQGQDYHLVLRHRMQQLMTSLGLTGRCFVDTAPVMERYWAWRCGLGFRGRNTQMVIPHVGSAFFIGTLFLLEEADHYDSPLTPSFFTDLCGTCHRCEEACPTGAITDADMDARRCLSYLTIEHKGNLPEWAKPHIGDCFFGCDRCLRSCPHLQHPDEPPIPEFRASDALLAMTPADWQRLTPEQHRELFRHSAVRRAKYDALLSNISHSVLHSP